MKLKQIFCWHIWQDIDWVKRRQGVAVPTNAFGHTRPPIHLMAVTKKCLKCEKVKMFKERWGIVPKDKS
jgi:hypothetical protein